MIEQFRPMKPKRVEELPIGEQYLYQLKVDGGNAIVDVKLPNVTIIHAGIRRGSILAWNKRTYRYPELIKEIREGIVLQDNATYIGELTCHDELGIGRLIDKRRIHVDHRSHRPRKGGAQ